MARAIYLFEAKGIQRYLFDSGKLKDVVGASDLIATLANSAENDLLAQVLASAGLTDKIQFSRRASAAFVAHGDSEDLVALRRLWRLAVQPALPGLEMSDALRVCGKTDWQLRTDIYKAGSALRDNSAAHLLPIGTPFHTFVARTGRIAVASRKNSDGSTEPLDQIIAAHDHRYQSSLSSDQRTAVGDRFLAKGDRFDSHGNLRVFRAIWNPASRRAAARAIRCFRFSSKTISGSPWCTLICPAWPSSGAISATHSHRPTAM